MNRTFNRIFLVIDPDEDIQQQFCSRICAAFSNCEANDVDWLVKNLTRSELTTLEANHHDSYSSQTFIIDLCPHSIDWAPIQITGWCHILIGEFDQGRLIPFSVSSGIKQVAQRQANTELAIVSYMSHGSWKVWLHAIIPTLGNWRANQKQLIETAADYAFIWLRRNQLSVPLRSLGVESSCTGISQNKFSLRQLVWLKLIHTSERIFSRIYRTVRQNRQWRVGWIESDRCEFKQPRFLPSQKYVWYADPFLWRDHQNKSWLLCEQFDEKGDGLGRIALFEILENKPPRAHGVILEESFHLSFPRLVEYQDRLYATVESSQNQDVRLYEADLTAQTMKLKRILLEGEQIGRAHV